MEVTYLPRAAALGARILPDHEVRSSRQRGPRRGRLGSSRRWLPFPRRSASRRRARRERGAVAVHPPPLRASGRASTWGRTFAPIPAPRWPGSTASPIRIWEGATQSFEVDEFRSQGFKMEVVGLPVELAGVRLPGLGAGLPALDARLPEHGGVGGAGARRGRGRACGRRATGRASRTPRGAGHAAFREGVKRLCEMHFAAGARARLPGRALAVRRSSPRRTSSRRLDELPLDPRHWSFIAATCSAPAAWAGPRTRGVVGWNGAVHGVRRALGRRRVGDPEATSA